MVASPWVKCVTLPLQILIFNISQRAHCIKEMKTVMERENFEFLEYTKKQF